MATQTRAVKITDDYFDLIKRFPLVPIGNDRHLKEAHKIIDELSIIDEDELTGGQAAYLAVISDLTEAYEAPTLTALTKETTGLEVLKHLIEEHDMTGSDLGRILGHRELGAKVLRGDRQISREHAKLLGKRFGIPAEIFLRG